MIEGKTFQHTTKEPEAFLININPFYWCSLADISQVPQHSCLCSAILFHVLHSAFLNLSSYKFRGAEILFCFGILGEFVLLQLKKSPIRSQCPKHVLNFESLHFAIFKIMLTSINLIDRRQYVFWNGVPFVPRRFDLRLFKMNNVSALAYLLCKIVQPSSLIKNFLSLMFYDSDEENVSLFINCSSSIWNTWIDI